ncbi:MAG: Gfo/Idh/MocA family oxidoreductase [Calditrichaceae bacterium]|nr:Gfo/Idh/MocA family oxidoreductase [Calditrichaceae bacterium]RQV93228.1 MAG: gfo/Idh/MocA family oxidoreductase [Calditrichota bacterium]
MNPIRWGIIGCGDVTEIKSGPAFQKASGSELIAVMRRNGRLAADYARRHHVPKWYDNADDLINDPDVNAVYIATPPSSHKEYTLATARAGKPVYGEKPMALNYAECQEMISACEKAGVPLFVAYYRRALPGFLKIKELLDHGMIGAIRHISIFLSKTTYAKDLNKEPNWRVNPEIAGCGYFCDLASHTLDLLHYYFGAIKSAAGYRENQTNLYIAEDIISAVLQFDNGIIGAGSWIFNARENIDMNIITGTKGKITFSTFENSPVILETSEKTRSFAIANPEHIQQPLIQSIVDELKGTGRCPSTGRSASLTNIVMDWILK